MPSASHTGSTKKLSAVEVSAMDIISKNAAAAGR